MRYKQCRICQGTGRAIGGGLCGGCAGRGFIWVSSPPKKFTPPEEEDRGWGRFFLVILVMATIWAIVVNSQPAKPPRTDNQRPQGVTEEQFKKDPTFGKLQIAKFGSVYKYYDTVFMQKYLWQPDPNKGCTFSKTAPDDDVKIIREIFTTYRATTISSFEVVSRNREIPRKNLIPVADLNGDGVPILTDSNTTGEAYYYSPPASASPYELEKAAALLRNDEKQ